MRKHDIRKWLHAVLDLLPVILIPVFMIYSHRHTIDSGSIQVPQNEVLPFNQLCVEELNSGYYDFDNSSNSFEVLQEVSNNDVFNVPWCKVADVVQDHYYYLKITSNFNSPIIFNYYSNNSYSNGDYVVHFNDNWNFDLGFDSSVEVGSYQCQVVIIDLTNMFGSGQEPTIDVCRTYFTDNYYQYTLNKPMLIKGISTITYDDSDIMSQVVYQLYNSVDKYFNMGNVFNMTGVYDWFNLNIFNGNAPISIYIVWNIVLYEFVMDLLFLLYGLFMWFIDMIEKLMQKPLNSIK